MQNVAEGIWALVCPPKQRNLKKLGNNAIDGLIVTSDGAVLADPGGRERGASIGEDVVQTLTYQPARFVINTGGQDHRWLRNAYWQAKGAKAIACLACNG